MLPSKLGGNLRQPLYFAICHIVLGIQFVESNAARVLDGVLPAIMKEVSGIPNVGIEEFANSSQKSSPTQPATNSRAPLYVALLVFLAVSLIRQHKLFQLSIPFIHLQNPLCIR